MAFARTTPRVRGGGEDCALESLQGKVSMCDGVAGLNAGMGSLAKPLPYQIVTGEGADSRQRTPPPGKVRRDSPPPNSEVQAALERDRHAYFAEGAHRCLRARWSMPSTMTPESASTRVTPTAMDKLLERRTAFTLLRRNNPGASRKQLRALAPWLYEWLRRYDTEWLLIHLPRPRVPSHRPARTAIKASPVGTAFQRGSGAGSPRRAKRSPDQ